MRFGEFSDHLVHETLHVKNVDGYKANKTRKRVGSFPFKMGQSSKETGVPGPQTKVVVAPKGDLIYFAPHGCKMGRSIQGGGKNAVAGIGKKCGKMRKKCGKCEKKCGIKCGFAKML